MHASWIHSGQRIHSIEATNLPPVHVKLDHDYKDNEIHDTKNVSPSKKGYRCLLAFWRHFQEFCENTSLHGLKYLGEARRPALERLCWLVAITISLTTCTYLIGKVWRKWNDSPVIVSFDETSTPVWDIPFPAVTICSEVKVKQTLFNFTEVLLRENRTAEEREKCEHLAILCDYVSLIFSGFKGEDILNISDVNYLEEYAPKVDDIMDICYWNNIFVDCGSIFTPILTEEGICYTFNTLTATQLFRNSTTNYAFKNTYLEQNNATSWTLEGGYDSNVTFEKSYPHRVSGAGSKKGLVIVLKTNIMDMDFACRWPVRGFKILLHNPAEFPQMGTQFIRVPMKRDVVAVVRPSIMETSSGLESYAPKTRQCFFSYEKRLLYFNVYTQGNCEMECLINITREVCSCTAFYVPSLDDVPVCGAANLICYSLLADGVVNHDSMMTLCECLPSCTEIKYDVETSQSQLVWPDVERFIFNSRSGLDESDNFGKLSIYFKNVQFMTNRRSELYGLTDFLANCGGILGLCLGFSMLSAVEIFYFLSVRLCGNSWIRRRSVKTQTRTSDTSPKEQFPGTNQSETELQEDKHF